MTKFVQSSIQPCLPKPNLNFCRYPNRIPSAQPHIPIPGAISIPAVDPNPVHTHNPRAAMVNNDRVDTKIQMPTVWNLCTLCAACCHGGRGGGHHYIPPDKQYYGSGDTKTTPAPPIHTTTPSVIHHCHRGAYCSQREGEWVSNEWSDAPSQDCHGSGRILTSDITASTPPHFAPTTNPAAVVIWGDHITSDHTETHPIHPNPTLESTLICYNYQMINYSLPVFILNNTTWHPRQTWWINQPHSGTLIPRRFSRTHVHICGQPKILPIAMVSNAATHLLNHLCKHSSLIYDYLSLSFENPNWVSHYGNHALVHQYLYFVWEKSPNKLAAYAFSSCPSPSSPLFLPLVETSWYYPPIDLAATAHIWIHL